MTTQTLTAGVARLYPELGGAVPDLEQYASSIILRVLNEGDVALQAALLEHYGQERVRAEAHARVHRLTNPTYRRWATRLGLAPRSPATERIQALWRA
jgi:hypothetical protein